MSRTGLVGIGVISTMDCRNPMKRIGVVVLWFCSVKMAPLPLGMFLCLLSPLLTHRILFWTRNPDGTVPNLYLLKFGNKIKIVNPLPHGRKTLCTPQRQVMIDRAKDNCTYEVKNCSPYNFHGIAYFYDSFLRFTVKL